MSALLLAAALAAPAQAADDGPVEVLPVGLRDLSLSGGRLDFSLVVEVERVGGPPMALRGLDYRVVLDEETVAQAAGDYRGLRLKKGVPVEVSVPVSMDAGRAVGAAWRGLSGGRLSLSLEGKARVWWLFLPLSVPFESEVIDLSVTD